MEAFLKTGKLPNQVKQCGSSTVHESTENKRRALTPWVEK